MNDTQDREQPSEHEDLRRVIVLLRTHGTRIAIGLAVVLLALAVPNLLKSHREKTARRASQKLFSARSVPDLEAVIEKYGATPVAPVAQIKLAKAYYDAGNFEMALTKYTEFLERHPSHDMAAAAELGRVHCLEARGETESALKGFSEFMEQHPGHFLSSQALFGRVRCMTQLGRLHEAKAICENYVAARPDSVWLLRAKEEISTLEKAIAKGEQTGVSLPPVGTVPAGIPIEIAPTDTGRPPNTDQQIPAAETAAP